MNKVLLLGGLLVIAVLLMLILKGNWVTEMFSSPVPTMKYSECRNNGYSKEYCLSRFEPGRGVADSGWFGRIILGSRGDVVVGKK